MAYDLNWCLDKFDKLTPQDGADLNDLQTVFVFEITEGGQSHNFTLQEYAQAVVNLSPEDQDIYVATAGGDNPARKVRKS